MADAPDSGQERTEDPTPRRREDARREGRVARSPELGTALALIAGTLMLAGVTGPALGQTVRRVFAASAEALAAGPLTTPGALALIRNTGYSVLGALLPLMLAVTGTVVAAGVLQTQGALSTKPLAPKLSNLNPTTGLKRLFGAESVVSLLQSTLKLAVLGVIAWVVLSRGWPELIALSGADAVTVTAVLRSMLVRLAVATGLGFVVVAGADMLWKRYRHEKSLRMTRPEVAREHRETEGDPIIKARIQSIARARSRQRMFAAVPTADVVVVNPTHIAIALRYDVSVAPAPIVVAMGKLKVAERIRELAVKSGVPIIENRPVARALLASSAIGKPIAPALYEAIAEILAFVYRMRAPRSARVPTAGGDA